MSYCPECGEQIAKDDIFCPFCGISIKPIVPVEDNSMSETIVDMPQIAINKEALDALTAKSNQEIPKPETQNAPVAEPQQKSSEPTEKPQDASAFSAGNTSENWTMKTESVEIPAEALEDVRSIPLPSVFGDDESVASTESAAPEAIEPSQKFESEAENVSESTEKTEEVKITGDFPAPAVFEDQESKFKAEVPTPEPFVAEPEVSAEITEDAQIEPIEYKTEEPQSFEPAASETIDAPADFQDTESESSVSEEVVEHLARKRKNLLTCRLRFRRAFRNPIQIKKFQSQFPKNR
jgi:hypothetical protein